MMKFVQMNGKYIVSGENKSVEHKLYYQDPYIRSFSANVIKQVQDPSGQWYIILDQTAFYPTGGGQPHDTGTINGIKVINVEEIDGEIRHYLESPLQNPQTEIFGVLDWQRRFDHMQQHAGQHILSAAFEELLGFHTISFHLGSEMLTIDLETEELTEEQAQRAEERANQIILENRPIEPRWVSPQEVAQYPLRKQLSVTDDIRLVIIPDYDYNGCGGTHPNSTGQVTAIKILDWERQKKKIRVSFVCGSRLLTQLGNKQKVLKQLSSLLNAPESEMVTATQKLLETAKEKDKALEDARESLLHFEAQDLIQASGKTNIISTVFQNRSIQELQKLARTLVAKAPETVTILISENESKIQLVCARGEVAKGSMKQITAELLPLLNGKGGGNDAFAQGGGEATMTGEELRTRALDIVK